MQRAKIVASSIKIEVLVKIKQFNLRFTDFKLNCAVSWLNFFFDLVSRRLKAWLCASIIVFLISLNIYQTFVKFLEFIQTKFFVQFFFQSVSHYLIYFN